MNGSSVHEYATIVAYGIPTAPQTAHDTSIVLRHGTVVVMVTVSVERLGTSGAGLLLDSSNCALDAHDMHMKAMPCSELAIFIVW